MNFKNIGILLLIATHLISFQLQSVEDSIIPLMEKFETLENLPEQKFAKEQFNELKEALVQRDQKIRIVSYNMLFNLYDHNLPETHRWPQRQQRVIDLIKDMQPDLIGAQELYQVQKEDLMAQISDEYEFYSKPAADGELNGIFYRKSRFEVLEQQVWSMTETPEIPSSETLTMLKLKDLITEKVFAVFNTHLAFSKIDKRIAQAHFIAAHVETYANDLPVLLTGDFNTFPARQDLEKMPFFDGDYVHRILTKGYLRDARELSLLGHIGPISTFTNDPKDIQPFQGLGTPGVFLDHIYATSKVTVLLHAVQPGKVDGEFPSDHMPIIVDFILVE